MKNVWGALSKSWRRLDRQAGGLKRLRTDGAEVHLGQHVQADVAAVRAPPIEDIGVVVQVRVTGDMRWAQWVVGGEDEVQVHDPALPLA